MIVGDEPPADAPEQCPNCGQSYTAVLAPDNTAPAGPCDRQCLIGTAAPTTLAGWRVVHR